MDRKPKARRVAIKETVKPNDPNQSARFVETARTILEDADSKSDFERVATMIVTTVRKWGSF